MRTKLYFAEIRRRLFQHGILGRPAARLVEELEGHFAALLKKEQEAGHDAATAQRMAQAALGEPEAVAESAADNLMSPCWIARHPYLFSVALGFGALLINLLFLMGIAFVTETVSDGTADNRVVGEALVGIMNWTVLLGGGVGLWWMTRRYVLGWRALFCACLAMTVFVSLTGVFVVPSFAPGFGPKFGGVTINLEASILGMIYTACAGETYSPSQIASIFSPWNSSGRFFFFHLLSPVVVFLALRYLPRSTPGVRSGHSR